MYCVQFWPIKSTEPSLTLKLYKNDRPIIFAECQENVILAMIISQSVDVCYVMNMIILYMLIWKTKYTNKQKTVANASVQWFLQAIQEFPEELLHLWKGFWILHSAKEFLTTSFGTDIQKNVTELFQEKELLLFFTSDHPKPNIEHEHFLIIHNCNFYSSFCCSAILNEYVKRITIGTEQWSIQVFLCGYSNFWYVLYRQHR